MIWKISNDRVQSPIVKSSIMWNRIKSSLLVLFLLFALFFGTMMIQQNAILSAEKINTMLLKTVRWSHEKILGGNYEENTESGDMELHDKIVKLIVLAYPRTGSSFTGDILSSSSNSTYMFEPLYGIKPFGEPVDNWATWNQSVVAFVEDYMNKLFNCDNTVLSRLPHFHGDKHKNLNFCNESNYIVIKTIRLHKINLDPWILNSDIKIIHLIRDPRAMFNSMAKAPKTWEGSLKHVDAMCFRMMNDTLYKNLLPSDRYFMLKYEDLMLTPISTMVELFTHLKLDFDIAAADALYNHTRGIPVDDKSHLNKYYSTYRTADNDIYKWKKELNYKNVRLVENSCSKFLKYAGYPFYKSERNSTKTRYENKES